MILLLDQNNIKSEDEKNQFSKYKEKVFDEVLILDDCFAVLKEIITDTFVLSIFERFYKAVNVKNLRFYLKVFKSYNEILFLAGSLKDTSKSNILENLLIIMWVDTINPSIPLNSDEPFNIDLKFLTDNFSSETYLSDLITFRATSKENQDKDKKSAFRNKVLPNVQTK